MKKLLIFDLDGTLLDTLDDLAGAVNYSLRLHNLVTKDKEFVRKAIGNGVAVLISRCIENGFDNPLYNSVLKVFREYYLTHYKDKTKPYENMKNTLQKLHENGYLLAVVSNKLDSASKDLISNFFPGLFKIVQGDSKEFKKKPNPDMVNHVLNRLKINKHDAIYIGDTNVDYETATNAGIDVILVTYGYRTIEEMSAYNYNCSKIDNPLSLLDIFC